MVVMATFRSIRSAAIAGAVALLAGGIAACESTADAERAAQTDSAREAVQEKPGKEKEDAANDRVRGVRVLTQADEWPGKTSIEDVVTPVRVHIDNGGRIPIDVRYRDLTLLGPDGKRYNAVPPYRIDAGAAGPTVDPGRGPVINPAFTGTGFEIAPYYSAAYPGLAVYEDVFVFDRNYYDTAYRYWEETELPNLEMLQQALPEGVVLGGGNVEGWVYFEKVPKEVESVVLHTDLVDSRNGRQFAQVRVPHDVN